jgi:hypothetical protein
MKGWSRGTYGSDIDNLSEMADFENEAVNVN